MQVQQLKDLLHIISKTKEKASLYTRCGLTQLNLLRVLNK